MPLDRAAAALVLVHGRGGSARDILTLADELAQPGYAYLAPQAAGNSWYPRSFLAPIDHNEPYLSSALDRLAAVFVQLAMAGIPAERVMLLGFSQGACLALEFAARNPRRYGGVIGFSGGLIGPDGHSREYSGSMEGTPVFLGCSDRDPHIPKSRVVETAAVLEGLGAEVTLQLYPGLGHTINREEVEHARALMAALRPDS